jgi:phage repressor protein C with HTH and peptisase S24 domain
MQPAISPGDVVVVSPAATIRRGDEVVVRTIDGECFCKVWGGVSGGIATLISHNANHAAFTVPVSQIAWVYPVVQLTKRRR